MNAPPDQHRPLASDVDARLLDADGRVACDVLCVKCGYNLRTLLRDGHCPECNHPVVESIRPVDLLYAPLPWLRRLSSGCRVLLLGVYLSFSIVLVPITALVALVGILQLTSPDPRTVRTERRTSARRITRYAILALPVLVVMFIGSHGRVVPVALILLFVLDATVIVPVALLLTVRRLARLAGAEDATSLAEGTIGLHVILALGLATGPGAIILLLVLGGVALILWIAILAPFGSALKLLIDLAAIQPAIHPPNTPDEGGEPTGGDTATQGEGYSDVSLPDGVPGQENAPRLEP